jgi:hypothetical protein
MQTFIGFPAWFSYEEQSSWRVTDLHASLIYMHLIFACLFHGSMMAAMVFVVKIVIKWGILCLDSGEHLWLADCPYLVLSPSLITQIDLAKIMAYSFVT